MGKYFADSPCRQSPPAARPSQARDPQYGGQPGGGRSRPPPHRGLGPGRPGRPAGPEAQQRPPARVLHWEVPTQGKTKTGWSEFNIHRSAVLQIINLNGFSVARDLYNQILSDLELKAFGWISIPKKLCLSSFQLKSYNNRYDREASSYSVK